VLDNVQLLYNSILPCWTLQSFYWERNDCHHNLPENESNVFIYSSIHSFIHRPIHLFFYQLIFSIIYLRGHAFVYSLIHSFTPLLIYALIHFFIRSWVRVGVRLGLGHSFIHSFWYYVCRLDYECIFTSLFYFRLHI